MRFAVVDDMEEVLKTIHNLIIQYTNDYEINVDCYASAGAFLDNYSTRNYDALFLDIDMPDISGFKIAEILHEHVYNIPIVYITGRDDLITNAFRYKPIGFVRKQHLETELEFAIDTIKSELNMATVYISVKEPRTFGGKDYSLNVDEILYFKTAKHYLEIKLINNKAITIRDKISNYSDNPKLKNFVMIDSGILINLAHIKVVDNAVELSNGERMLISRRRVQFVLQAYIKYSKKVLI